MVGLTGSPYFVKKGVDDPLDVPIPVGDSRGKPLTEVTSFDGMGSKEEEDFRRV